MDDEPTRQDQDLLVRLNALKLSNVTLKSSSDLCTSGGALAADETPEDLVERFQRNHGRRHTNDQGPSLTESSVHGENRPPSPTIEELLAELDPDNQHMLDFSDLREAQDLLAEAKSVLPTENARSVDVDPSKSTSNSMDRSKSPSRDEPGEGSEAEAALQRILDESEHEDPSESALEDGKGNRSLTKSSQSPALDDSFAALNFPSTPDSVFESLALPSVPTTAPSRPTKAPGFSHQEIDSWCVICCDDANVLCFGCDKDLYCWGCWREGHIGESAGLEEKNHVWERFSKAKAGSRSSD